jgi:hypothetical protein
MKNAVDLALITLPIKEPRIQITPLRVGKCGDTAPRAPKQFPTPSDRCVLPSSNGRWSASASAGLAAPRAEGRIGGRRKKLDDANRREIAEAVVSGRKTAAQIARVFGVSPPTVSRIVAAHAAGLA